MTMREGARLYAPAGRLLAEGDLLDQPGLVAALELIRDEGALRLLGLDRGGAARLVADRNGRSTGADLRAYRAEWSAPVEARFAGRRVLTRGGLADVAETLGRFDPAGGPSSLLAALDDGARGGGHTTNLTVVDGDGNACVLTTSLGLGSGDWVPGLDLHLNSMLGETDLVRGALVPGTRMESMMAPTFALDGDGLELALGAAGGTRLRTALVGVLGARPARPARGAGRDRPAALPSGRGRGQRRARRRRDVAPAARSAGRPVRRWAGRHHYFGGVSAVGRSSSGADPRRSGLALQVP